MFWVCMYVRVCLCVCVFVRAIVDRCLRILNTIVVVDYVYIDLPRCHPLLRYLPSKYSPSLPEIRAGRLY